MRRAPSGEKTCESPYLLHAFEILALGGPMHFKYEKFFFDQNQSVGLWPPGDNIGSGLRPEVPARHGPEGPCS